jgi:hypothetical protein
MNRGRCFLAVTAATLAVALWLRAPASGDPDDAWVIEPAPEDPQSLKAGAAELERALGLAKKKDYAEAAKVLEVVARRFPAALHDCNLSLAYLRAGALTRAQLMWDLSSVRNAARPNWCTGDLSSQLSTALRAAGFVPVSLDVPADAVIEVAGVKVRGIKVLWLPTGPATLAAHAPGKLDVVKQIDVTAPSARVQVELVAPPLATPDAMPVDAPTVIPDAPVVVALPPPVSNVETSSTLRYVSAGTALAGWIGGTTFYVLARSKRDDANELLPSEPAFDDAKSSFETRRILAYSLLAVGAIATGYFTYDVIAKPNKRITIQPSATPTGAGVSIGGAW